MVVAVSVGRGEWVHVPLYSERKSAQFSEDAALSGLVGTDVL